MRKSMTLGLATAVALAAAPFASAQLPERPDLNELITNFRDAQQELVQERRDFAESLRDLSVEDRRAAIDAYMEQNADRIALHRALSEQIRELMKASLPGAPDSGHLSLSAESRPDRPEFAPEVQELIEDFHDSRAALIQERRDLLAELKDATDEERAEALAALREQNADLVAQQKEMARQIRESIQDLREERRNTE